MSVRQFVTLIFESESESSEYEMMSRFIVKENGSALLVSLVANRVSFDHRSRIISLPS